MTRPAWQLARASVYQLQSPRLLSHPISLLRLFLASVLPAQLTFECHSDGSTLGKGWFWARALMLLNQV